MYLIVFLDQFYHEIQFNSIIYSPSILWSFIRGSSSSSSGSKVEDPGRGNMPKNKVIQRDISISTNKKLETNNNQLVVKDRFKKGAQNIYLIFTYISHVYCFNPLHPIISLHILHTAPYTFTSVLKKRICLPIKSFLLC